MADARDEIKERIDAYGQDIKNLVNIKPQQFDVMRISAMVQAVPERKWNAAQGVVNATILKKDAEQKFKMAKATAMMVARHNPDLKAAPDRLAWVDNQATVQQAEIDLINADAELLSAKLAYECLDDLFTAGKRIMEFLIKQDQATNQYARFSEESKRRG